MSLMQPQGCDIGQLLQAARAFTMYFCYQPFSATNHFERHLIHSSTPAIPRHHAVLGSVALTPNVFQKSTRVLPLTEVTILSTASCTISAFASSISACVGCDKSMQVIGAQMPWFSQTRCATTTAARPAFNKTRGHHHCHRWPARTPSQGMMTPFRES